MGQWSVALQGGYPSADVNEHEELRENVPQACKCMQIITRWSGESRAFGYSMTIPNDSFDFVALAGPRF